MKHFTVDLKKEFPELSSSGDVSMTAYLHTEIPDLKRMDQLRPAILICPGGGYILVSEREAEPVGLRFLCKGYQVYTLHYSPAPHTYPTQLREVAACLELISRNAQQWNTDPGRIALMGFSAGGHLAAHYANCYDSEAVRQVFPDSKPVKASILGYPVITSDPQYTHAGSFRALLDKEEPTQEEMDALSVEKLVRPDAPQAFIWHTAKDALVNVNNSILYARALAKYEIPFALQIYPFGGHGLATADWTTNRELSPEAAENNRWFDAVYKWLDEVL